MISCSKHLFLAIALWMFVGCDKRSNAQTTKPLQVGTIAESRINEASGLVASRKFPGVYWTHNDGEDGVLYAINRDGSLIGAAKIDARVRDWEDIAIDDAGNLYIADTGNNSGDRKHVFVYRVREPDPATLRKKRPSKLAVDETWKLSLPNDRVNIESLFVFKGIGYLIFKQSDGVPAEVDRFDLADSGKAQMEKAFVLPVDNPVTAADISADGKQLAVLARGSLWIYSIDGDVNRATTTTPTRIALPSVQTEGCCFGDHEILINAESREMFAVPWNVSPTTHPAQP